MRGANRLLPVLIPWRLRPFAFSRAQSAHRFGLAALLGLISAAAGAAPPTLEPAGEPPTTVQVGEARPFQVTYRDADGDRPREVALVMTTPSGAVERLQPELPRTGDLRTGVPVTWQLRFEQAGTYRLHVEAASRAAAPKAVEARWPASGEREIAVVNPLARWAMLGAGLGVALLLLPMFLFFVLRGASRKIDPGAAARVALMVGILAAGGWYTYLFWSLHGLPVVAIVDVLALGAAFVLGTMRK